MAIVIYSLLRSIFWPRLNKRAEMGKQFLKETILFPGRIVYLVPLDRSPLLILISVLPGTPSRDWDNNSGTTPLLPHR